jgi:1-acyl-sn-glycerol-3-phosphate acyltransferase
MWDLRVTGSVPDAPFVVAANHFSHLDPVIVGRVAGQLRYLAVDEIFGRYAWFDRAMIREFGAIPLSRVSVQLSAMRTADSYLRRGGVVGIFPEGKRVWTWGEVEPKRGAAWLALRTGVPLVPLAIWGTQDSFGLGARRIERRPVRVEVGPPLQAGDYVGHPLEASKKMIGDWESWLDGAMVRLRDQAIGLKP